MTFNHPFKVLLVSVIVLLPKVSIGVGIENYSIEDKLPIVEFVTNGFLSYVGKYPGYRAKGEERVKYMLETFGKPIKIEKLKKEDWREPGLMRDHVIRYFNGVIIETSTEVEDGPQYVETIKVITLENPKYKVYKDIKIGMSFSKFAELLNVKDKKILDGKVAYAAGWHLGRDKVTVFVSQKGIITKIVWDYLEG